MQLLFAIFANVYYILERQNRTVSRRAKTIFTGARIAFLQTVKYSKVNRLLPIKCTRIALSIQPRTSHTHGSSIGFVTRFRRWCAAGSRKYPSHNTRNDYYTKQKNPVILHLVMAKSVLVRNRTRIRPYNPLMERIIFPLGRKSMPLQYRFGSFVL